jgi:hypothetical protein
MPVDGTAEERPTNTDWELLRGESSHFSCPHCRGMLVPVSAPDRFAFAYGCSTGHVVGLGELFDRQSVELRQCVELLIATWQKSIRQMAEGAGLAGRHGSQELAQRFHGRMNALEAQVKLFRETFLKGDPG